MNYEHSWLLIELGGSSAQTAERDEHDRFHFTPGVVRVSERPVALACPGLVRNRRVLYATNLGWPEDADPCEELGIDTIPIIMNDAEAAALGESVLRGSGNPTIDLCYIGLGTGVGSAAVRDGMIVEWNLGHCVIGGDAFCEGCRTQGCLNAYLAADRLPNPFDDADQRFVAQMLATALERVGTFDNPLMVIGGGMGRRYPAIASQLAVITSKIVETTAAPPKAKSAAYAGLDFLAQNL